MTLLDALTHDGARDAARDELSRQPYQDAKPSLLLRVVGRVARALADLVDGAAARVGDGALARVLLLAVVAAVAVAVLVRLGPLGRGERAGRAVLGEGPARSAQDHRASAEQAAAAQRWAEAVRERLRAVVRELEARGVLDPRPGRTAVEVAGDAGAAVPALADDLGRAARVFDEVVYGGRPGTAEAYAVLVALDDRVRGARPVPV